jgi:acyl-coenzyme A thioesterase PaaI-like protein
MTGFDPAAAGWARCDDKALPRVTEGHWMRREAEGFAFGFETGPAQDNGNGVVHGGILATCMDHTMGRVARNAAEGAKVATIQLDLHYLAGALPGQFIEARGEVVRRTRSVIFLRGTLMAGGRPVLSASGIWKILGAP